MASPALGKSILRTALATPPEEYDDDSADPRRLAVPTAALTAPNVAVAAPIFELILDPPSNDFALVIINIPFGNIFS
jgi:hypothetical protein